MALKECQFCGCKNQEDATHCLQCKSDISGESQTSASVPPPPVERVAGIAMPPPPMFPQSPASNQMINEEKTNGLAIAALVLGLASLLFSFFTGVVGLILGIIAAVQISNSGGRQKGMGMAIAGIGLSVILSLILPALLFPSHNHSHEKARQTQCTSNIKQLTTALQIYVQENNGKYPDAEWIYRTGNYGGIFPTSYKVLSCPDDVAIVTADDNSQISYGYNGLLIKVDGKGVTETMITCPTMVGAFADATYGKTIKAPGLIGGSAGRTDNVVDIAYRHNGRAIVGFVDGHARLSLNAPNTQDTSAAINQGFISAPALGYLTYQGSGITKSVSFDAPTPTMPCSFAGDFCTMPIMSSAATILNTRLDPMNMVLVRNFVGQGIPGGRNGFSNDSFVENQELIVGVGDGSTPTANAVALGKDVVVAIKAKNSNIPTLGSVSALASYFTVGNANVYTYDQKSGTRAFFYSKLGLNTGNDESKMSVVYNDFDMVQQVTNNPNSIGFCSAAFADPNLVDIITIGGVGLSGHVNAKQYEGNYLWPDVAPTGNYPFTRTLYAQCAPKPTANGAAAVFQYLSIPATTPGSLLGAIQSGPLFKLSYFVK